MKVKVAIVRNILTAIWHVLSEDVPYRDYQMPEAKVVEGNS